MSSRKVSSGKKRLPDYLTGHGLYIPIALNRLIDVIGFTDAMELVLAWGGLRKRIPINPVGSKLEEFIGPEKARAVCLELAEEVLEIPLANNILVQYLHRECRWPAQRIANRLRMGRRTVQHLIAGDNPTWPENWQHED